MMPRIHADARARARAAHARWAERQRALRSERQGHYTCSGCGISYLLRDGSPHARAGLCKVCYYERRSLHGCDCPRIRGDTTSVYACDLCPELTGLRPPRPRRTVKMMPHAIVAETGAAERERPVEILEPQEVQDG